MFYIKAAHRILSSVTQNELSVRTVTYIRLSNSLLLLLEYRNLRAIFQANSVANKGKKISQSGRLLFLITDCNVLNCRTDFEQMGRLFE